MKPYKRNLFQRLLGICATREPSDKECWSFADGKITVDLANAPELEYPGSGMRLESKNCPERVLVIYGEDCQFHAYRNRCEHGGRRIDPIPGDEKLQCCSLGKTMYDYEGNIMAGPAKGPIKAFPIDIEEGKLIISID